MFVCCWRGGNEDVAVGGRFGAAYLGQGDFKPVIPLPFNLLLPQKPFSKMNLEFIDAPTL